MFKRIQRYLIGELGSDDVRLILADADSKCLILFSNKPGNGYKANGKGIYQKTILLDKIEEEQMKALKNKDTRFYGPTRRFSRSWPEGQYTFIEFREPDAAESGILSSGTSYAYCRTDRLARILSQSEYGFSADGLIVHEGAHGIISLINERLEDLFEEDESEILGESVAQLVGIKYLEKYLPDEAARYKGFISNYETDPVHAEAFRIVLNERSRAEEMKNLVRFLIEASRQTSA